MYTFRRLSHSCNYFGRSPRGGIVGETFATIVDTYLRGLRILGQLSPLLSTPNIAQTRLEGMRNTDKQAIYIHRKGPRGLLRYKSHKQAAYVPAGIYEV